MAFTDWILWIPVSQPQKVLKMNDKSSIEPTSELSQILKMLESVVELVVARHTLGMPVPAVAPASAVPAAVKPSFHIRTKPEHINWAVIGGAKFTNPPSELFLSAEYRASYRPGEERTVYAACCPGLGDLANSVGLPLSKVSTCAGGRLVDRIRELNSDQYGGTILEGASHRTEAGWDDWFAIKLRPLVGPCAGSPVTVAERGLLVRLPETLRGRQFDDEFDEIVRHGALQPWLATRNGRRQCAFTGFDAAKAQRFTIYDHDSTPRVSEAKELCIFRKSRDHDRLVAIIEYIILRHLRLVD